MPLTILVPMILIGLALVAIAMRLLGLSKQASISAIGEAISVLRTDYPDALVEEAILASNGKAAILKLEDGSAGLVEAMGDRFITRILAQKDVRQVERKGECDLVLRLADFTLPRLTLTFAEPKAALKAATWLTGNQDA
ncbi:MAG: hypothetical protein KDJ48_07960 [Nitratireductor sp.]|nr:hypothetical protein [Nitratireductor sp.]MCB1459179.1 hypothetical protein [Nitratireductor sp.]